MKFQALFNKRNYFHLYNMVRPFPFHLKSIKKDYSDYKNLIQLIEYFEVNKYKKIVVVASGPSAKNLIKDPSNLYFCCNDSIKLLKDLDFVYMLQDPFYLMKYLKTFKGKENWKGTVYWFYFSISSKSMYNGIVDYLNHKSRTKREFLITNNPHEPSLTNIYNEINLVLKESFNYQHFGVNSGFNTLVFAAVLALKSGKPLESYGLDAGVGGERYFHKNSSLGLNIKKENTKIKITEFLQAIAKSDLKFVNHSNFKGITGSYKL